MSEGKPRGAEEPRVVSILHSNPGYIVKGLPVFAGSLDFVPKTNYDSICAERDELLVEVKKLKTNPDYLKLATKGHFYKELSAENERLKGEVAELKKLAAHDTSVTSGGCLFKKEYDEALAQAEKLAEALNKQSDNYHCGERDEALAAFEQFKKGEMGDESND